MKLKKLKKMFEPLTRGGFEYVILEYVTSDLYPIKIVVRTTTRWDFYTVMRDGSRIAGEHNNCDLIPIKKEKPEKPVIDYSKLPKNVLCEVGGIKLRYSNGNGVFFGNGLDSSTAGTVIADSYGHIKIIDNPVRPVIGNILNEIPDNVRITLSILDTFQGREEVAHSPITGLMQDFCSRQKGTAIFYQILGE